MIGHLIAALTRLSDDGHILVIVDTPPEPEPEDLSTALENLANVTMNYSCYDFYTAEMWAYIRLTHYQFLCQLYHRCHQTTPAKTLSILARALNALRLHARIIFQPCWSARRWKSLT